MQEKEYEKNFQAYDDPNVEREEFGYDVGFDPARIDITPWQASVYSVVERIRAEEIDLYPEYQREENIWPAAVQSRLIESIMIGIPLPAFYFTDQIIQDSQYKKWEIVDGLQRLCALRNFIIGWKDESGADKKLHLSGLEYVEAFNGLTFERLPPRVQRTILEAQLTGFMIRNGTPEDVKFNIFKRLNTGGRPLRPAEIRNAMYQGCGVASFIRGLAESEPFRLATCGKISGIRMADREFVSRFVAFYVQPDLETYRKMDSFIGNGLKLLAKKNDDERERIRNVFFDSMSAINAALGEYAFCQFDAASNRWVDRLNKALFEVMSVSVARLTVSGRKRFMGSPVSRLRYKELFAQRDEGSLSFSVTTSTARKKSVIDRYAIISEYLESITGEKV